MINVTYSVIRGRYLLSLLLLNILPHLLKGQSQTEIMMLSGHGADDPVAWDFMCTGGRNSGKWSRIAVPSCWELQGFGKYDYGFAKDSIRGKEQGFYRRSFSTPSSWKGRRIEIVFEGVMTDAEVKINGKSAGPVHQGAFYAFRFDVTRLIRFDRENLLEVKVSKHSANQSVNEAERKADFWIFGGIFRPVRLEALPVTHIRNVAIDARADGRIRLAFDSTGSYDSVSLVLKSMSSGGMDQTLNLTRIVDAERILLEARMANPRLWTPETPERYEATIAIYRQGKELHREVTKFGFRTVEVKPRDGIYVNGIRVKLKGVNRHTFRPETGRTSSRRISEEDVMLMKEMNMNAVRMSHYPPDGHFLDVCDSLGLFVLDELAGWHGQYDTETGTKLMREMIDHDVNHPSVIMWVNGNEGGHNRDLDPLFAQYDLQQRHVIHAWERFNGFDTQHYREFNYGIGNYDNGRDITLPTEFLHGQFDGGHGAGLEDYWEKMWRDPLSAGGFLWDFADNAVVRRDLGDSLDTDKHRGADGILGPHLEKEGSFFAIREIWSPVFIERREISKGFDGSFILENRYHFTNINACRFQWTLKRFGMKDTQTKDGQAEAPSIMPGQRGKLNVNLPDNWNTFDVLDLTVIGPDGKEVMTRSHPISTPAEIGSRMVVRSGPAPPRLEDLDSTFRVYVTGSIIDIRKRDGILLGVSNSKGNVPFHHGPVIQQGVNNFGSATHRYEGDDLLIETIFDRKVHYNTLRWTIHPSGWIRLQVDYFPGAYFTDFIGVNFSMPESEIRSVTYMGDGPYRVWKNRMKGNRFGVWTKEYNTTETGEFPWKYPEFKGYHSRFYGGYFQTRTQRFTVVTETEDLFLRLFTPAWKTDAWHNYEPIFPTGDISFMHGISSIGSKTQRNVTTGPMGGQHILYDYEKEPSRRLNMVLYFNFNAPR